MTTTTSRLKLATWNIGNGTLADARGILARGVAALALQEASDQTALVDALAGDGFEVIQPRDMTGQPATPLVYDPDVLVPTRPLAQLVAPGRFVGRGTGPDHMKPKWLIGAFFVHRPSRRRIAIASHHRVAGQTRDGDRLRDRVALADARRVARAFAGYHGVPTVLGDWNSLARDDSLAPLRDGGWTSNQLEGGRIATHHHWAPDHVWWRTDDRISFVKHETIGDTHSDHRPLVVSFDVTRTRP